MGTYRHGHRSGYLETPEYIAWKAMRSRCHRQGDISYGRYGALGIRVCDEWRRSFQAFLGHVGPRPSADHSIDRIDNARGYEPGNVRWATRYQQRRNLTSNRMITINGETKCLTDWATSAGLGINTIVGRLRAGWPSDQLLSPADRRRKRQLTGETIR